MPLSFLKASNGDNNVKELWPSLFEWPKNILKCFARLEIILKKDFLNNLVGNAFRIPTWAGKVKNIKEPVSRHPTFKLSSCCRISCDIKWGLPVIILRAQVQFLINCPERQNDLMKILKDLNFEIIFKSLGFNSFECILVLVANQLYWNFLFFQCYVWLHNFFISSKSQRFDHKKSDLNYIVGTHVLTSVKQLQDTR